MAKKHIPFVVDPQQAHSLQRKRAAPKRRRRPPLFTVEDAFSHCLAFKYDREDHELKDSDLAQRHFDVERGLRAIAFLLSSITKDGSENLDGQIALGISVTLERYASEIDALESARRVRAAARPAALESPR